jgi:hypothetical protein
MSNNLLPAALRRRRHVKTPSKNDRRSCCMAILQNYQTIVLPGDFDKPTKEMPQEKTRQNLRIASKKKGLNGGVFPLFRIEGKKEKIKENIQRGNY